MRRRLGSYNYSDMLRLVALLCCATACFGNPMPKVPLLNGRIIGGGDADIEEIPWQVSVQRPDHYCGGSIIGDKWVLSAVLCARSPASAITIRAGTDQRGFDGVIYQVAQIIIHPLNNYDVRDYDYALFQIVGVFEFGPKMQPVALPKQDQATEPLEMSYVSGWGDLRTPWGAYPLQLQVAVIPVMTNEECSQQFTSVTSRMICAGVQVEGLNFCNGDTGGPMVVVNADGVPELIGVISWNYSCGAVRYPGVYARTSAVRTWIAENTGIL